MDRANSRPLIHICCLLVEQLEKLTIVEHRSAGPLAPVNHFGSWRRLSVCGPRAQSETKASARLPLADLPDIGVWTVGVLFHPPPSPNYQHVNEFVVIYWQDILKRPSCLAHGR